MNEYSIESVTDRILELESLQYSRLCPHISVENVQIEEDKVLADVRIGWEDIEELLIGCEYPDRLFHDCTSGQSNERGNLEVDYERIMNRLAIAESNEEGTVLDDIKKHIHRLSCYYKWMFDPDGALNSNHYALQLEQFVKDAEGYLVHLYS